MLFKLRMILLDWCLLVLCCTSAAAKLLLPQELVDDDFGSVMHFMADLAAHRFSDAQHVVVLGSCDAFLRSMPCPVIVAKPGEILEKFTLHTDSVFIIMRDDTFSFCNLPRHWLRAHFMVLVPQDWILQNVSDLFSALRAAEIANVVVLLPVADSIQTFVYEPYGSDCWNASHPLTLADVTLSSDIKVANLHGCVLKFTVLELPPDVIVNIKWRQKNKQTNSVHPSNIAGVEMELVLTLAQKMNFTPHYSFPTDGTHWGWLMDNGTISGMVGDVFHRVSDVGIGHVTPNVQVMSILEYSAAIGMDCYGWGIPLGAGHSPPAWMTLTSEFSGFTWVLLFLTLCVSASALWTLSFLHPRDHHTFHLPAAVLCFTCNSLIASPVVMQPRSSPVRTFIAFWLLYCIVVSVAYQAQLGSIVTVPWAPPDIHSLQELIESSLELTAPWKVKSLLDNMREPDDQVKELLRRLKPESNVNEMLENLQHEKRRFAYLSNTRSLSYYSSQSGWKFQVLTEDCMLRHHTSLVVRMGSPLLPHMNLLIGRLTQAGLFTKWQQDYTARSRSTQVLHSGLSFPHLLGVFILFAMGLFASLLVLALEVSFLWFAARRCRIRTTDRTQKFSVAKHP